MSDTPITNEARLRLDSDDSSCAIYTYTLDGSSYHGEVVRGDKMQAIELENAAMREAIKEAHRVLENARFVHQAITTYVEQTTFERQENQKHCDRMLAALAKLQPFLKP